MSSNTAASPEPSLTMSAPDNVQHSLVRLLSCSSSPPPSITWTARSSLSSSRSCICPSWAGIPPLTTPTSRSTTQLRPRPHLLPRSPTESASSSGRAASRSASAPKSATHGHPQYGDALHQPLPRRLRRRLLHRTRLPRLGESGNFPAAIKATTEWFPQRSAPATGLFTPAPTPPPSSRLCHRRRHRPWDGTPPSSAPAPWVSAGPSSGCSFPTNRLRRRPHPTQIELAPITQGKPIYSVLPAAPRFWASPSAKVH